MSFIATTIGGGLALSGAIGTFLRVAAPSTTAQYILEVVGWGGAAAVLILTQVLASV